jgi:hypothetical protein
MNDLAAAGYESLLRILKSGIAFDVRMPAKVSFRRRPQPWRPVRPSEAEVEAIYAVVRDGRFVGVEGMQEAPANHGRLCPKAFAAPQWVYSPQRLKHPLKRVGQLGEGKSSPRRSQVNILYFLIGRHPGSAGPRRHLPMRPSVQASA